MKNKYTPGPWGWFRGFLVQVTPDGRVPMNSKVIIKEAPDVITECDSVLLAAAPRLFEALKRMTELSKCAVTGGPLFTAVPKEYHDLIAELEHEMRRISGDD